MEIKRVLIVCTGNSCRSVMAEALLKKYLNALGKDYVEVTSAGTSGVDGMPPAEMTVKVLAEEEIDYSLFRSRKLYPRYMEESDLVLVMAEDHKRLLDGIYPQYIEKIYLYLEYAGFDRDMVFGYDVTDPIGLSLDTYRDVKNVIKKASYKIADKL